VQDETLRRRLARGERLVGLKLGLTSRAKQQRMGIGSPLVAWLTDAMVLPAGAPVPRERFIHSRAEPEIMFVMGSRLAGPGVPAATALAAVGSVYGGVEVIYSPPGLGVPALGSPAGEGQPQKLFAARRTPVRALYQPGAGESAFLVKTPGRLITVKYP
jgi:hypothetical protein